MISLTLERARCLDDRSLHLILLPTEACNFRCVYCYEEFRHRRMEPEVVRGVKRLLDRRAPDLAELTISWFGGEPLLASDIMEDLMSHARGLVAGHPAIRLRSDVTTNGYLLGRDRFSRLVGLGIGQYQISFDGPRAAHDRKRVLHGGKGTFDRIWGNLLAVRGEPGAFRIVVRVHVDRENRESIPEFLDEYERAFGGDPRFQIFLRPLSRLGGPNDSSLAVFEHEEGRRAVQALRDEADRRGLRQDPGRSAEPICYAARANSFVIRSNGRVNKCTVALEQEANQVGVILEDGTLRLDPPKLRGWMRGLASGDPAALRCPMIGHADRPAASAGAPVRLARDGRRPARSRSGSLEPAS